MHLLRTTLADTISFKCTSSKSVNIEAFFLLLFFSSSLYSFTLFIPYYIPVDEI